jgi:hypothetical protein
MTNRAGNPQQERKINSRPPSPSKGKSTIQIEDEAESNKNKFEPLETLDPELISSKENTEENTHDQDVVLEIHPEDPDPQHQVIHQTQEEDSQEESGEEMDVEIPKNVPTTKARKENK